MFYSWILFISTLLIATALSACAIDVTKDGFCSRAMDDCPKHEEPKPPE